MPETTQLTQDDILLYLGITFGELQGSSELESQETHNRFWNNILDRIENPQNYVNDTSLSASYRTLLQELVDNKALKIKVKDAFFEFYNRYSKPVIPNALTRSRKVLLGNATSKILDEERRIKENARIRIGSLAFGPGTFDPTSIAVEETFSLGISSTIRSDSETVTKLPQSTTTITLRFVFAGADAINGQMRRFLAELLASPVTTVESPFLTAALVNYYSSPEIENAIRLRVLNALPPDVQEAISKLDETQIQNMGQLESLFQDNGLTLEYLTTYRKWIVERAASLDVGVNQQIEASEAVPNIGVSIPVVVRDIVVGTDTSSSDCLVMTVVFSRINAAAFGAYGLEYRDAHGNPTIDAAKCPWIQKYAQWAFLDESKPDSYLARYNPSSETPDFKCTWRDIRNMNLSRVFPVESQKFSIISVQGAMSIKSAMLPIVGSRFPATQIMGRSSVSAEVILETVNVAVVREFSVMKDHLDALSRGVGGAYRDEFVLIQNSVLNMMGAYQFIISNVEVIPKDNTSDAYTIIIRLQQSKYRLGTDQLLLLVDETVPNDAIKAIWKHLERLYREYVDNIAADDGAKSNAITAEHILAVNYLFGLDGRPGVLNAHVFGAAFASVYGDEPYNDENNRARLQNAVKKRPEQLLNIGIADPVERLFEIRTGQIEKFPELINRVVDRRLNDPFAIDGLGGYVPTPVPRQATQVDAKERIREMLDRLAFRGSSSTFILNDGRNQARSWFLSWAIIKPEFFEAMLKVILEPLQGYPLPDAKGDRISWSENEIFKAHSELAWLFNFGAIQQFGSFDYQKYYDSHGQLKTQMIPMDKNQTVSLDGHLLAKMLSNYPDLPLPTYREMFSTKQDGLIRIDTKDGAGAVPLWTKFAPRWSDIGVPPPFEDRLDASNILSIAYGDSALDMPVEPGFWFYHKRLIEDRLAAAKRALDTTGSEKLTNRNVIHMDIGIDDFESGYAAAAATGTAGTGQFHNTFYQKILELVRINPRDRGIVERTPEQVAYEKAREKGETIDFVSSEGVRIAQLVPTGKVVRGYQNYELRFFTSGRVYVSNEEHLISYDREDQLHQRSLVTAALTRYTDNALSMSRCYPAFRLFFVEWDDNYNRDDATRLPASGRIIRQIDDLYTTNAVESIHITKSKDEGDVAVITIRNTVGTFDRDSFVTAKEANTQGIDEDGEDFLRRMRLQTGTGIVIKMGYSSRMESLDTVFTGQIVEYRPGGTIVILAQGYKSELDQEIVYMEVSDTNNERNAINKILTAHPCPHLGRRYDSRDLTSDQKAKILGDGLAEYGNGFLDLGGNGGYITRLFGTVFSSITRNVWFNTNVDLRGWVGRLARAAWDKFGLGNGTGWRFLRQTMWQCMQEMARHVPGSLVAIRPFDSESTVFFGYPEQPYQYRTPKGLEVSKYNNLNASARIPALLGTELILLESFWNSRFGTNRADYMAEDIATSDSVGGQPGKQQKYPTPSTIRQLTKDAANGGSPLPATGLDKISKSYSGFMSWAGKWPYWTASSIEGLNSRAWNQVPFVESDSLDFTQDWDFIASYGPELTKFLISWYFKLKVSPDGVLPGAIDGRLTAVVRDGMAALRDQNASLTEPGKQFYGFLSGAEGDSAIFNQFTRDLIGDFWSNPQAVLTNALDGLKKLYDTGKIEKEEYDSRRAELEAVRAENLVAYNRHLIESLVSAARRVLSQGNPTQSNIIDTNLINGIEGLLSRPDIDVEQLRAVAGSVGFVLDKTLASFLEAYRNDNEQTFNNYLLQNWRPFRIFVHYFSQFLRSEREKGKKSILESEQYRALIDTLAVTDIAPWFKPFRRYHTAFSGHDIIESTIYATTAEMANTVLVRGPKQAISATSVDKRVSDNFDDAALSSDELNIGSNVYMENQEWVSFPPPARDGENVVEGLPIHPEIPRGQRKLYVAVEPNAYKAHRLANTLITNMADAVRPMYRGYLKLVGRSIDPWDIITLEDDYQTMHGIFEVDRVTHEFSAETGWITTLEPHLYCQANNPYDLYQVALTSQSITNWTKFGKFANVIATLFIFLGPLYGLTKTLASASGIVKSLAPTMAIKGNWLVQGSLTTAQRSLAPLIRQAIKKEGIIKLNTTGVLSKALLLKLQATVAAKLLARSMPATLGRIGSMYIGQVIIDRGITWGGLVASMGVKARIYNTTLPIEMRPLNWKGMPMVAGCPISEKDVIPFFDKVVSSLGEIYGQMTKAFFEAISDKEPSTPGEALPE